MTAASAAERAFLKRSSAHLRAVPAALVAGALCVLVGCGDSRPRQFNGNVKTCTGSAEIWTRARHEWTDARPGMPVEFGDSLRTSEESLIEVVFGAGNTLRLGERSKIGINESDSSGRKSIEISQSFGSVLSHIEKLSGTHPTYSVRTPTAVASIRGTYFCVLFDRDDRVSRVNVLRGSVAVVNPFMPVAPVLVEPGFFTSVTPGAMPLAPIHMNYVHWKRMGPVLPPSVFVGYGRRLHVVDFDDHDARSFSKQMSKRQGFVITPFGIFPGPVRRHSGKSHSRAPGFDGIDDRDVPHGHAARPFARDHAGGMSPGEARRSVPMPGPVVPLPMPPVPPVPGRGPHGLAPLLPGVPAPLPPGSPKHVTRVVPQAPGHSAPSRPDEDRDKKGKKKRK